MRSTTKPVRYRRAVALAALLALVVAACGTDADPVEPDDAPDEAPDEAADAPDEPADEPDAGAVTVALGSTEHGEVLVDGDGMTLYVFDPDDQGPSTCYDECADAWPPLVADDAAQAGDGVDAGLLGTVERDDGSTQITYDGWPLYYWASDTSPGDATGQGVQDVWWVIEADATVLRGGDDAGDDDTGSSGNGAAY